jgi:K+-sensing histidine kinase KdpD
MIAGLSDEYSRKGLALTVERPLPDAFVNVDEALLQNVIINVLENSAKYKITENGTVSVSIKQENSGVKIRLSDNGTGVPNDALDKLFDIFYRADPSRGAKGNGLGLAVSAKITRRMGGEIYAEKAEGGGLAIIIGLPLAAGGI